MARRPAVWLGVVTAVAAIALITALGSRLAGPAPGLGFGATASTEEAAEQATPEVEDAAGHAEAAASPGAGAGAAGTPEATLPVRPDHHYTLDGSDPEAYPTERTALAFVELDDPAGEAYREFGPPQRQQPDINEATANVWSLPGGAEFVAVAAGTAAEEPVLGLIAEAPEGSGVRLAAHGGVVLGSSTPAEVAEAWGPGYDRSRHPGDDFVLQYTLCRGPWPVVVKFDQPDGESWDDAPVTRVLIAYTDDDPQAAGCPAT